MCGAGMVVTVFVGSRLQKVFSCGAAGSGLNVMEISCNITEEFWSDFVEDVAYIPNFSFVPRHAIYSH